MKKLFVFVPAILLGLFLLNSFVLKEKEAAKAMRNKSGLVNTVFKSTDADKPGRTSAKDCQKICRKIVSAPLQMINGCF